MPMPGKKVLLQSSQSEPYLPNHPRQSSTDAHRDRYLVFPPGSKQSQPSTRADADDDDDAAEASHHTNERDARSSGKKKKKEKSKGQNTSRHFGSSRDRVSLCQSRATSPEFSPAPCRFGDTCNYEHDLRRYLKDGKREDLRTFNGLCPVWFVKGICNAGWKCRFVGSHSRERVTEDGRKELVLMEDEIDKSNTNRSSVGEEGIGLFNVVSTQDKIDLTKRKVKTPKADAYCDWLEKSGKELGKRLHHQKSEDEAADAQNDVDRTEPSPEHRKLEDNRAQYTEPPFLPSEKRRLYFGPQTPVLAPLTTQGNLPFRRLCVELGAEITYSEMAMSLPLLQGQKSEWALMRAHESEIKPPHYLRDASVVTSYDNFKDLKFGAQIAANKPWQALKATEVLTKLCPHLRVIDLNCGCPIDLVYRTGAGSALLDNQSKLEKIIRGMNAVSGDIPITAKIRMGTRDGRPNALKLVERLVFGGYEANEVGGGSSGVAALTLHGRSRQQRYTKNADWGYISECAALIKRFNAKGDDLADTIREADARTQAANGQVYFIGNGDCYSHVDYNNHIELAKVDSVMIARGALIKPWIFEEIQKGQYLDKSASERLGLVEQYARYGLQTWGSDEMGVGTTRRFLLEWLSFAHRYVPLGILEHLPPSLQDRPPAWKGRNELETLLGSDNYKDWIKIRYVGLFDVRFGICLHQSLTYESNDSEMFLGPAHEDFKFEPKHKSNSYEIEAEG